MSEHDIATYVSLNWLKIKKKSFGLYDVAILVDYTHAKNEPSEHVGSREMSIGANCVKIRICRKNCKLLAVFNIKLLSCIFSLQFVNVHLTYISLHIL
jgi:hypothetical protein